MGYHFRAQHSERALGGHGGALNTHECRKPLCTGTAAGFHLHAVLAKANHGDSEESAGVGGGREGWVTYKTPSWRMLVTPRVSDPRHLQPKTEPAAHVAGVTVTYHTGPSIVTNAPSRVECGQWEAGHVLGGR